MLLASRTLRQGLRASIGYQRVWGDGDRFAISDDAGACRVSFRHPGSALARAVLAECALAEVVAAARRLVDPRAVPLAVELAHAPLGDTAAITEYFGVPVRHESPVSSVTFGSDLADRPMHLLRDLLARALEAQCQHVLAALPQQAELGQRVRSVLSDAIERGPTLGAIARRLKMSARTLQRRLSREGTSFQELLDLERRARAEALLRQGAQVKEAAFRVGYADPSALARARRRWIGRRP